VTCGKGIGRQFWMREIAIRPLSSHVKASVVLRF